MSEAADRVAKSQEEMLRRTRADEARRLSEMTARLLPLAASAAANLKRLGYPVEIDLPDVRSAYVETIRGERRAVWVIATAGAEWGDYRVGLVDDGTLIGLKLSVDDSIVAAQLKAVAIYPERVQPPKVKPKRRTFGKWLHDWLQAQGFIR